MKIKTRYPSGDKACLRLQSRGTRLNAVVVYGEDKKSKHKILLLAVQLSHDPHGQVTSDPVGCRHRLIKPPSLGEQKFSSDC